MTSSAAANGAAVRTACRSARPARASGSPSFATGTDTCDRYESACGYNCDSSDYPATAPAPTPQPQSAPAPTPQPQSAPTPQRPRRARAGGGRRAPEEAPARDRVGAERTGVSCSKNKHCEDGEFCKAPRQAWPEADECFVGYGPGDEPRVRPLLRRGAMVTTGGRHCHGRGDGAEPTGNPAAAAGRARADAAAADGLGLELRAGRRADAGVAAKRLLGLPQLVPRRRRRKVVEPKPKNKPW